MRLFDFFLGSAVVIGMIALLVLIVFVGSKQPRLDDLRARCLTYETIGDMPAECIELF